MNRPNLTPRQADVYRLVVEGCNDGNSPTMVEIGRAIGIGKVTVFGHVCDLIKKGYIQRIDSFKARNLSPVAPIDHRYTADTIAQSHARELFEAAEALIDAVDGAGGVWLEDELSDL